MLRIYSYVLSARSILVTRNRRRPMENQFACFSRTPHRLQYQDPSRERMVCPPPPPPKKPPRKDDRLFWGTMALLVSAGAFAAYAKTEPEIRDWITINAPWFDDFIAVMYQENMSYGEWAVFTIEDLRKRIACYIKNPLEPPCPEGEVVPLYSANEKADDPCGEGEVDLNQGGQEGAAPCKKLKAPIVTKDLCEIEECMTNLGNTALNKYKKSRDICRAYNKTVQTNMLVFNMKDLDELHRLMDERLEVVKNSIEIATKAKAELDELIRYFDCGITGATKEQIQQTKLMLQDFQTKIKAMRIQFEWENDYALAYDSQWLLVEDLMMKYTTEMQTAYVGLNYKTEKPHMAGDPDIMLYHTQRYVEYLKAELQEAAIGMTERINRGMEGLPQDEKSVKEREALLKKLYGEKKAAMDNDYKKRSDDQKAQNTNGLKDGLKNQSDKGAKTLASRLAEKEKDSVAKLNKIVAEAVVNEKKMMALQLSEMANKLRLVEEKLEARLKVERETRRSQDLWAAGASLLAATKKGEPYVKVDKELQAIEKASGDGDKLVLSVLKAIPKRVREVGLVPESVLKERYALMEDTALKVALVEQEGAPLPVYFMSWIQAVMLFMKISGIPQSEIDKPPKEVNALEMGLDTFDLLQRARYWVERGNLAIALKYVAALEGASLGASEEWGKDARSHLETRQAAEAVIAHAAALGLQYI